MDDRGSGMSALRTMIPPVTPREKIERARVQITISSDALLPAIRLLRETRDDDLYEEIFRIQRELAATEERLYARAKRLQEDGQ